MENIFLVPELKKVKISDFRMIKEANLEFKKGLNIIIGKNASGKTTALDCIREYGCRLYDEQKEIIMERMLAFGLDKVETKRCLIIDDVFNQLATKELNKRLSELSKSKNQIIITLVSRKLPKIKANIIDTADFKLQDPKKTKVKDLKSVSTDNLIEGIEELYVRINVKNEQIRVLENDLVALQTKLKKINNKVSEIEVR